MISVLIQIGLLAVVLAFALAAGYALARLAKSNVPVAAGIGAVVTLSLTIGLWFLAHGAFEKVETDQVAVATLVTSVVGVLWLAGLAGGYALSRPRG